MACVEAKQGAVAGHPSDWRKSEGFQNRP
jgi:hypothetical protein